MFLGPFYCRLGNLPTVSLAADHVVGVRENGWVCVFTIQFFRKESFSGRTCQADEAFL
jgi:hypothetical protein